MKKIHTAVIIFFVAIIGGLFYATYLSRNQSNPDVDNLISEEDEVVDFVKTEQENEVLAQKLSVPWEIAFLPEENILLSERSGWLKKIGADEFAIQLPGVVQIGEGGLLGLALHPDYEKNHWIYLYYTSRTGSQTENTVERFTLVDRELSEKKTIIGNIPAAGNHNGGRIKFSPDGFLYITTGDAGSGKNAQDTNSLAGKILRVKDDGSFPADNPFDNAVYSYGHRNVQGLAWDSEGRLWATEHGRSGVFSGYDELNQIKKGANYGWPEIQGDEKRSGMETPVINSGASDTWAPSGAAYFNGSIFFAGLRGQALYEYKIDSREFKTHFKGEFGRLRNVNVGPDRKFYLLTNNTDGRGSAREGDDKLIKIDPSF